jgi:hypothetical protein
MSHLSSIFDQRPLSPGRMTIREMNLESSLASNSRRSVAFLWSRGQVLRSRVRRRSTNASRDPNDYRIELIERSGA